MMTPDFNRGGAILNDLNESHRRHLAVSIRHIARLLDEAERALIADQGRSDLAAEQVSLLHSSIERLREKLVAFASQFQIETASRSIDLRHALTVQVTMAGITVDEMRARSLRGYGALDEETADRIERGCDDLQRILREVDTLIANG